MKCAVLTNPGRIEIREQVAPEPQPDQVLIEIDMAAVCGSDASLYRGKYEVPLPVVPGHEAVGHIVGMGDHVTDLKVGQRVVIQPNYSCRTCGICRAGQENICPDKVRVGLDVNGVFSQYIAVRRDCAWPVPEGLPDEIAVFAEPTAVVLHAFLKARPRKGQRVLIIGAGVIGLLMVQLAVREGVPVYTLDLVQERLRLSEQLGARGGFQDAEAIAAQGPFDVVYETSGAPVALSHAVQMAAPGAGIVVLGLPGAAHPLMANGIVRKELKIYGSIIYTNEFPMVLELLEEGAVQTKPLVTSIVPIEELSFALEEFSSPKRIKTLISMR